MALQIRTLIPAVFVSATLLSSPLIAAEAEEKPVEIGSYLCKDIMRLSGTDRDIAIALLHGYMLGKKGAVSFVSSELSKLSNDFMEACLDNPQGNAMSTFEEMAK